MTPPFLRDDNGYRLSRRTRHVIVWMLRWLVALTIPVALLAWALTGSPFAPLVLVALSGVAFVVLAIVGAWADGAFDVLDR